VDAGGAVQGVEAGSVRAQEILDMFPEEERYGTALFSSCERYRYAVSRNLVAKANPSTVAWVLCNPSTATATDDDPTIRRCINFSKTWGYERMLLGNAFALRSTDPRALYNDPDPVGPDNDKALVKLALQAEVVVCGWGTHGKLHGRGEAVKRMLLEAGAKLAFLRLNQDGSPGHPLYVAGDTASTSWTQ